MLRKRKTRGYNETNDEEEDGGRKYDLREKIRSERFNEHNDNLQVFNGNEITLRLIQRYGFEKPMLVKEPEGLELRVPQKGFLVRDVCDCVGDDRIIDVMDVRTQKNIEMTMKDWCKYYESKRRDRLLNVISLEFSHTELDDMVEAPSIVKLLDWVDLVWPKFLKESQTESTNKIDKMKYPKVQKYCLMSVKGSYTDFHIDFGGTSVWYHILKGKKIFWMVPPTELNLQTFEEWTLSGMQQEVFFGDTVEECFRVELTAGNTFFIPSGWIHAVFTLEDSLVFGGNFLHSFGIENQLKVSKVEDATKVPVKFRYPFYTEIQWYVVQHYVRCLTGKDHLHPIKTTPNTTPEKPKPVKPDNDLKSSRKYTKRNFKDDESETESEKDESDTKTRRKRDERAQSAKAGASRRLKKQPSDNEIEKESETEIDTENETDEERQNKKKPATCRMTKNSLLRLQYEVDQPIEECHAKSKRPSSHDVAPPQEENPPKQIGTQATSILLLQQPCKTPLDIDRLKQANEPATLNGWSSTLKNSGNQTSWSNTDTESEEPKKIHITKYELNGLKLLVKHLSKLSGAKKNLPSLIRNSRSLLDDCKKLIIEHENDDPELAVTGEPITLDLLNSKKSDINQLIEQFFKPTETTANEEAQAKLHPPKPKIDSATLTHQQRKKINYNDSFKNDEKKTAGSASDSSSSYKEAKNAQSPIKKMSSGFNATAATTPVATSTALTTASATAAVGNLPRPKSPPTRPLSNNQYTSKTKRDNSLILPGSFADLIAATSTEKKVFDVSSSDMTSTLFGVKDLHRSPTKPTSPQKIVQSSNDTLSSIDSLISKNPSTQDNQTSNAATDTHLDVQSHTLKPNSPEPPKMSPQKRFINPAVRPQNKEKLIFASAPYVSPISISSQSRAGNLYPWQSPAPHQQSQTSHQRSQTTQAPSQKSQETKAQALHTNMLQTDVSQKDSHGSDAPVDSTPNAVKRHIDKDSLVTVDSPTQRNSSPVLSEEVQSATNPQSEKDINPHQSISESVRSLRIDSSTKDSVDTNHLSASMEISNNNVHSNQQKNHNHSDAIQPTDEQATKPSGTETQNSTAEDNEQRAKNPTKPRGPPKKSKEARQAIILSPPRPVVTSNQQVIVVQDAKPPSLALPSSSTSVIMPKQTSKQINATTLNEKGKPKVKRARKQKDSADSGIRTPKTIDTNHPTTRQSVICSLVAPPVGTQAGAIGDAKTATQQYLISRPLVFNGMPALSATQLQQIPRAPMQVLSGAMPTSLSLPTMQQGARIVWATQPRLATSNVITTTSTTVVKSATKSASSNAFGQSSTTTTIASTDIADKPKAVSSRSPSVSAKPGQPDNAALLSLATTALSTAPMPTTSTLSYLSGIRPPPTGQAIMVSSATGQPALLTGQPFFNPFISRLPLVGQYPTVGMRTSMPGVVGPAVRPIIPTSNGPRHTSQLVFARLPNQGQPRYLITHPYIQPRPQASTTVAGQPNQTLAFAAFRPPCPDNPTKVGMKAKKVKTR